MKNNDFWKFILVAFIICWSLYEIYPPTSRDLVQQFESRAANRDTTFTGILARLEPLQKARPDREFANLQEAIGTNDIQPYFPVSSSAKNQPDPNMFISEPASARRGGQNQARPRFAGRHVVPGRDGHERSGQSRTDASGALSQAVEVLRKRIDQLRRGRAGHSTGGRQPHFDPVARPVGGRQGKRQGANSPRRRTWNSAW